MNIAAEVAIQVPAPPCPWSGFPEGASESPGQPIVGEQRAFRSASLSSPPNGAYDITFVSRPGLIVAKHASKANPQTDPVSTVGVFITRCFCRRSDESPAEPPILSIAAFRSDTGQNISSAEIRLSVVGAAAPEWAAKAPQNQ